MVIAQRFLLLAVTISTTALTEVMRKAVVCSLIIRLSCLHVIQSKHTNVAKESVDIFRSQCLCKKNNGVKVLTCVVAI